MRIRNMLVFLFSVTLLCSCATKPTAERTIQDAVDDFYQADYNYTKESNRYDSAGNVTSSSIQTGSVVNSPYKEHILVLDKPSILDEMYIYEEHGKITANISTTNGWVQQTIKRSRPYGYDNDLEYTYLKDETLNDRSVALYTTSYFLDIGKIYDLSEDLQAEISQTYYLDKEDGTLVQIVTDLSDHNYKLSIAIYMSLDGESYDDATKKAALDQMEDLEILSISDLGNPTPFELPEL